MHKQLNTLMEAKGITPQELARLAGIHPTTIHRYLKGQVDPTFSMIEKIAEAIGVNSWDELLGSVPNSRT